MVEAEEEVGVLSIATTGMIIASNDPNNLQIHW